LNGAYRDQRGELMPAFLLRMIPTEISHRSTAKRSRCRRWTALVLTLLLSVSTGLVTWAQQGKQAATGPTRTEKDLLGEKQIPADAYYGVQTERALENFQLSGIPINHYPEFIQAWAIVKLAAAQANTDVGTMKPERLAAI